LVSLQSTNQYISLDLYFKTSPDPAVLCLEAYIVKDMNALLILGNDFTDQYSLSIICNNGMTSLKLGDSGYFIPLDSSVNSSFLEMHAFQAEVMATLHRKRTREKRKLHRPNQLTVEESITLSPLVIRKIPFKTTAPIWEDSIFIPIKPQGRKFEDVILINSKINLDMKYIHIINQSPQKIHIQELDILGTIKPLSYFDSDPPPDKELQSVQTFINIVNSLLRPEKINNEDSDEQKHQN